MVVFLKTSEEATCETATCKWTYTANIPILENVTASFDETALNWIVTVTGTDFSGDTTTTDLRFGGISQTTDSVSTTEAVFTIMNITSQTLVSNQLFFDIGIPENHTLITA
jgi:hypothetical protein